MQVVVAWPLEHNSIIFAADHNVNSGELLNTEKLTSERVGISSWQQESQTCFSVSLVELNQSPHLVSSHHISSKVTTPASVGIQKEWIEF